MDKTITGEYHIWFDSLEEMKAELPRLIKSPRQNFMTNEINNDTFINFKTNKEWIGCESAKMAYELMDNGWEDLLNELRPKVELLRKQIDLDTVTPVMMHVRRRKRHRQDYGDTLDIHRVWSGELDKAWERPVRTERMSMTERYATLFVDTGILGAIYFKQSVWRAAVALLVTEVMTRMGINTEVWVGSSCYGCYTSYRAPYNAWTGVRVKEYTQPLNDDRLVALSSAAFHRLYNFRMRLSAPYECSESMGNSSDTGLVWPLREREEAGERVFRVGTCLSESAAIREVKRIVNELKVTSEKAA